VADKITDRVERRGILGYLQDHGAQG